MPSLKEKLHKKFFPPIGTYDVSPKFAIIRHKDGTEEKVTIEEFNTYIKALENNTPTHKD
jgi:hypothetical protein